MTSKHHPLATPVLKLDEVDSTNAECLRRAAAGERGPLWITAERQTAGRGRAGRSWTQVGGNLAASLLFVPAAKLATLHQLSLLTGVAAHDAIEQTCGAIAGLRLKWPNDILIGRSKTGGILVETTTWGGTPVAVIGVGINIAAVPALEGRRVGRLADHSAAEPAVLLSALDASMLRWLDAWRGGDGFGQVRAAWLARAGAPGEPLSVNVGAARVEGIFDGIDDGGALLLRDGDGMLRRLTYGDVSLAGGAGASCERTEP